MKMKKVMGLLILMLLCSMLNPLSISAEAKDIQVKLNNESIEFDVKPVILEGRTLVPLRAIFEKLNMKVEWDEKTRTVIGDKRGLNLKLPIDSRIAIKNNEIIEVEVPATIIDGRTMVPVRFIAESTGAKVDWNADNNTVHISTEIEEVIVNNAEEFVRAIGPNKKIILKENQDFNLKGENIYKVENPYIDWNSEFDGRELVIRDVNNLTIEGAGDVNVNILVEPRYADVLTFNNCTNIKIININAGHTPEKGYCTGGVFVFNDCIDVQIENTRLFGCGILGLDLSRVDGFKFTNSIITECSDGIMTISDSKNISFVNSKFIKNEGYYTMIKMNNSAATFTQCDFTDNISVTKHGEPSLFDISSDEKITIKDSNVLRNKTKIFTNKPDQLELDNITFDENSFDEK
ncbi:stalk domain-containing protein [Wukongibacter baidiensis]|uniref:stalk domain-containing protein n=1 Tax=Wukongibacter baidiensis TaxID=1723361 RepID=UPI003D7F472F